MNTGYFMRCFDARSDLDMDGCSITLDLDIAELIDDDFGDHTVMLEATAAPILGIGLPSRAPAGKP